MKDKKTTIKHILSVVGFLIIAGVIYIHSTYLFRVTQSIGRINLVSFYNEEPNTLDMVVVGASGIFQYWDPMAVYEEDGVTSFSYACASLNGMMERYAIEEVLTSQNPDLIVVDGRRWLTRSVEEKNKKVRLFLDSIDYGINRFKAALKYCSTYKLSFEEAVPYFFEICFYHNYPEALEDPLNWELIDNRYDKRRRYYIKGFHLKSKIRSYEAPDEQIIATRETTPLGPVTDAEFHKFMEYCSGLDADVILLFTPSNVTMDYMEQYNELERIAAEYGISSWNGNLYYDEMGLDFATDFYDERHVNISGAEKFTKYFYSYLKEKYDFPDHRALGDRPSWDKELEYYQNRMAKIWKRYQKLLKKLQKKTA